MHYIIRLIINVNIKFINNLATYKKMILITPNARLTEDIKNNPFDDVMVIANNSSANTYIEKIQEHNDKE